MWSIGGEVVRDKFYVLYQRIVFNKCFYREYQFQAVSLNRKCSVGLVCISFLSATIWALSGVYPLLWTFLIGIAQLAQALSDLLPWKKQLTPLKFLCPKLDSLALEVELYWLNIDLKGIQDEEIKTAFDKFSTALENLCSTFADEATFPEDHESDLWKTATKKATLHFENRSN